MAKTSRQPGFMERCSAHQQPATGRCFSCHKPTCAQCKTRDGTCSDACWKGRQAFGGARVEQIKRPWVLPSLTKLAVLGAAAWAANKYYFHWW